MMDCIVFDCCTTIGDLHHIEASATMQIQFYHFCQTFQIDSVQVVQVIKWFQFQQEGLTVSN